MQREVFILVGQKLTGKKRTTLLFYKNSLMDGISYEQVGSLQINLDGKELVKENSVAFHSKIREN